MEIIERLYVDHYNMTKEDLSKEIINYFNNAIKYNTFFFGSTEDKKIIGYGVRIPHTLLIDVAEKLSSDLGIDVVYGDCYFGSPAHALIIHS